MSLINKMLKDLEKRDAYLVEDQDIMLDGLYSAYDLELIKNKKRTFSPLVYLSISFAILFFVVGHNFFPDYNLEIKPVAENKTVKNKVVNEAQAKLTTTNNSLSNNKEIEDQLSLYLRLDNNLILDTQVSENEPTFFSPLNRIDSIYFEADEKGLNLVMKLPKDIDYLVYGLDNPDRVVVEINNAELGFVLEELQPIEPVVAIRYSINESNRFKLVLESDQPLNIKKSITSKDGDYHDLVVVMGYDWAKSTEEVAISDDLSNIVDINLEEEKKIIFKGELVKTPVNVSGSAYTDKLFKEAYSEYKRGNVSTSLKKLNMILDHDTGHVNARSTLALILSRQGHSGLAYSVLNEGLIQYPNQPDWIKMNARILLNEGKVIQAKEVLVKHDPELSTNVEYYALLAAVLQKLDEHSESARIYRDLLQVNPLKTVWWMGLGISLESMKRYEDALYAYQKAYKNPSMVKESREFLSKRINMLSNLIRDEST